MLTTLNEPARMNLQLFGEAPAEPPVAAKAAEQTPPVQQEEPKNVVEFFNQFVQKPEGDPPETPPAEPGDPKPEPLILGKFKTQEELGKAYLEAEKKISQYGQQNALTQQELGQMKSQLQQLKQVMERPRELEKPQLTPEQIREMNQDWLDQFYENPLEKINQVIAQGVQQAINPIQEKLRYQENVERYAQQVAQAKQKYPDFDNYMPQMQALIQEQGQYLHGLPNAVDVVYNMAKGQTVKGPDDYLSDEEFRQKIIQDESIRNEILKQYAQQIQSGQPPVVLGKQRGEIPSIEPVEIKNTQDAKKASISFFQKIMGGGSQ